VVLAPAAQSGGAKVGQAASYTVHLTNRGFLADSYTLSTSGPWPAVAYDATCTTASTATASVAPGSTVDVCVKVNVPASAANDARNANTLTATSAADAAVSGTATMTTIAVASDTLLVDEDGNAPDVAATYKAAMGSRTYGYWDLAADPDLPLTYRTAHANVVWWTGNSYPAPVTPYEGELKALLDGGGRLMMSGQDILDQAAGTTTFVRDYLHISWDGTETQNDKPTATVTGVAANPVTQGLAAKPLDHTVLGANFEDQITPIAPATSAFTDNTGATDALTVATATYKVFFLAFPVEAYGVAADKSSLVDSAFSWFSTP
jgi:hypothetical protein